MVLGDRAALIGLQQCLQVVDLLFQLAAHVGPGDAEAGLHALEDLRLGDDVGVIPHGVGVTGEGLVGHDADAAGVVNEGITADAGGGLVSLAEAAVDDDQLAAALEGAFALFGLDGDMAVDDGGLPNRTP